jgi:hypothetical protein
LSFVFAQELNRLIRDNDRLQRIIVRHGGAELFRNVNAIEHGNASTFEPERDAFSDASFRNLVNSPGLTYNSSGTGTGTGTGGVSGSASKSPLYSSRIRESLTPPGKQRQPHSYHGSYNGSSNNNNHRGSGSGSGSGSSSNNSDHDGESHRHRSAARSVMFESDIAGSSQQQQHQQQRSAKYDASNFSPSASSRRSDQQQQVPDSPPPPPAPAPRTGLSATGTRPSQIPAPVSAASVLNWGALGDSLKQQQQKEDADAAGGKSKFSASHLPPDDFTLNEAMATTQSANNGKLGLGVESNALRVGKYMSKLEDYLQVCES